jgi:hypothetical protein
LRTEPARHTPLRGGLDGAKDPERKCGNPRGAGYATIVPRAFRIAWVDDPDIPTDRSDSMTAAQYLTALAQLGLNPTAAGRLLCVDQRTSRRYASRGIFGPPEILLKLLLTSRISADDVSYAIRYRSI